MCRKTFILLGLIFVSIKGFSNYYPPIDSLMNEIILAAENYSKLTNNYKAEIYLKTNIHTKKKNFLYNLTELIPDFVLHDRKKDRGLIESISTLRYEYPANYFQDIKRVTGTMTRKQDIAMLPFRFISIGVYEEHAPEELFYLPLRAISLNYYDYKIAYVDTTSNRKIYSINFTPKYKNPQLISGYFMVEEGDWRVLGLFGQGSNLFLDFSFNIKMGESAKDWFLPKEFILKETHKYLGNEVDNSYHALINYKSIEVNTILKDKKTYNLGNKYRVKLDSVPRFTDITYWDKNRKIPLSDDEKQLLCEYLAYETTKSLIPDSSKNAQSNNNKLAQSMVSDTKYHYKSTDIRYSGLLNPTMIGYSTGDGLTYKQSIKLNIDLERQQRITIKANAGALFKRKHFSFNLATTWNYEPAKIGYLSLDIGKGNSTYSIHFLNQLNNEITETDNIDLGYYKDYFVKLYNNIEIANGLQLGVGIDYHIREPNKTPDNKEINLDNIIVTKYHFVPRISLIWTPEQYYITDRNQKIYVRSNYPTFKFDYAQSLYNVFGSRSSYSRIEFDMSQLIRFDLLETLNYHIGIGLFTRKKNEYFNDFTYFKKNYFPENWGDGIGGSFSVLPARFFNSSDKYIQAHMMYETSNFLFTRLPVLSNGVAKERIYISQLRTTTTPSYTEIGYGIGNRFLNTALFIGFNKTKYYSIAGKLAFIF